MDPLLREIKRNRIARWAGFALALNALALVGVSLDYLRSRGSLDLWVPASEVSSYVDPMTRQIAEYHVSNVRVAEVAMRARWPHYANLYGALVVNLALAAWLLRIAILEHRPQAPLPSPPATQ